MKKVLLISFLMLSVSVSAVEIRGGRRSLFNDGERCGYVSLITSEESEAFRSLNIQSIPVFTFFPAELSTVSGVVTFVKQPRSSHIALKAKDWQIPNADVSQSECVKQAGEDLEAAFGTCLTGIENGDFVYMKASREGRVLIIEKAELNDPRCPELVTQIGTVEITADLNFRSVSNHEDLGWNDFNKVGSKAANYAELMRAMNVNGEEIVRPGFAIPFFYYNQFVQENTLVKKEIESILKDSKLNDPLEALYRRNRLEELQALIMSEETKINESFLQEVFAKAESFKDRAGLPRKLKFRSSTNAEDLPNFSGAGLYDSKSYKPLKNGSEKSREKKIKSLVKAIKTVWTSTWNLRAYDERALYGIPHDQVYMGVQVNLAFPDEIASGVVVTKNVLDRTGPEASYIEVQRGDEYSVVNPEPGVLAERILVEEGAENYVIKRVGGSTVDVDGLTILKTESSVPVLTDSDVLRVNELALRAELYFKGILGKEGQEFAIDIEFKIDRTLDGERTVYFKQARPYLIHE